MVRRSSFGGCGSQNGGGMSGSLVMTIEGGAAFAETVKSGSRILVDAGLFHGSQGDLPLSDSGGPDPVHSLFHVVEAELQTVDQCFIVERGSHHAADSLLEVGCSFERVEQCPLVEIRISLKQTAAKLGKLLKFVIEGQDV